MVYGKTCSRVKKEMEDGTLSCIKQVNERISNLIGKIENVNKQTTNISQLL
jgi:hypothetical protein